MLRWKNGHFEWESIGFPFLFAIFNVIDNGNKTDNTGGC